MTIKCSKEKEPLFGNKTKWSNFITLDADDKKLAHSLNEFFASVGENLEIFPNFLSSLNVNKILMTYCCNLRYILAFLRYIH